MTRNERGAAAVEFALILPLLVALLAGIAEFGRAYYLQTTLSAAARQAVRVMAIEGDAGGARSAAQTAASPLALDAGQVAVSPGAGGCAYPADAVVTITYSTTFMSGLFGSTYTLKGKGVMRCGG